MIKKITAVVRSTHDGTMYNKIIIFFPGIMYVVPVHYVYTHQVHVV